MENCIEQDQVRISLLKCSGIFIQYLSCEQCFICDVSVLIEDSGIIPLSNLNDILIEGFLVVFGLLDMIQIVVDLPVFSFCLALYSRRASPKI